MPTEKKVSPAFEIFQPSGDLRIRQGNLPHWYQPGVTYFVTFRTDDSVPQTLARDWRQRRRDWLAARGVDPVALNWRDPAQEREYHRHFSSEFMEYLDRGYGRCELRRPELAQIVADNLRSLDGDHYRLGDFVVMPNHVHLLACLGAGTEIEAQCRAWKTCSARQLNKALGRAGRFWQEESFDHLVRGPEQFERFQWYIRENPRKAGLKEGEFLLSKLE